MKAAAKIDYQKELEAKLKAANKRVAEIMNYRPSAQRSEMTEQGIYWIESTFFYDPKRIAQFIDSSVFFKWWNEQYAIRNYELIKQFGYDADQRKIEGEELEHFKSEYHQKHYKGYKILKPSSMLLKTVVSNHYKTKSCRK